MDSLGREYPVKSICEALDMPRSSYYRKPVKRNAAHQVEQAIVEVARAHPTYGSRRVRAQLRRPPYEIEVSRKYAQGVLRARGLLAKPRKNGAGTTDSRHGFHRYPNLVKDLLITRPNQVWVGDITYLHLPKAPAFLAILMDVYTRNIRGWQLSPSSGQELTLAALTTALRHYPAPVIHHSDQGVQYAGRRYVAHLRKLQVQISMTAVGKPSENGYAERVIRTIKEEEVYLAEYENIHQARQEIAHFIEVVYPQQRIHSALDYQTPAEFEAQR